MIKEYIIKCDTCKNEIVKKYDTEACSKLGIEIEGAKDYEKCIICGKTTYYTIKGEYENEDEEENNYNR